LFFFFIITHNHRLYVYRALRMWILSPAHSSSRRY
jgi:hypothetical protein